MATESMPHETNNLDSLPPVKSARTGSVIARLAFAAFSGVLGALLSWKVIAVIGEVVVLPTDLAGLGFGSVPSPEDQARLVSATLNMNIKNAAIWMGAVGAIFGAAFSLVVCAARRTGISIIRMMFVTTVSGALFGTIAGAVGIWIQMIARQNMEPGATSSPEQIILFMHSTIWLICGLGIGLGIALGGPMSWRTRLESTIVIGLVGMVGGCLFPIVAGIFFPAVNSTGPIPLVDPSAGRILWLTLPAVFMGLAIGKNS